MDCPSGTCALPGSTREEKRKDYETDPAKAQETWENLRNAIGGVRRGYFSDGFTAVEIESQLHDIWDELIHAVKITPATSAELDRLVTLVSETREFGIFTQNQADRDAAPEREGVTLPNGQRLWIDLPYLAQEVKDSWTKESMEFTPTERESVAVWTAKLCATGICPKDLSRCALWLFKQALETDRPVAEDDGQDDKARPTIHDLLPACLAWLEHSNSKLVKLSQENYTATYASGGGINSEEDNDNSMTVPGDLAVQAGITQPGFSIERWLFWRQRFKDLYRSGVPPVVKLARSCFEAAIFSGMDTGLEIPGEKVYLSRLFEALDKEIETREFKGCVGAEDIDIDMDWDRE
ncbi:hypothetical protein TRV_03758 [Trichophyton verrucosum HKI 0517]|uniref:Uncharacterized protein n=1 Tax=Trichophyton verrucosum (strain HKI 0517) TaxID=663202 RepID=D4D9G5_TRIVH|nr:uncharacterized protein TRV_03758 [Trichophyton verrucosum HKI 0517]EFE41495.1 hypothetical protein TRV_03758 [Trichophyton verrucosum HKI 0517]